MPHTDLPGVCIEEIPPSGGPHAYMSDARTRSTEQAETSIELSLEARIERLGRERPSTFDNIWSEAAFCFSIFMSQVLTEYFVSGFTMILPSLIKELDIPQSSSVWPASAFSLVVASTLLVFGRLGDMYGGYLVYLLGLAWLLLWSVIAGFSVNALMLDLSRAMQGLGVAASIPTGVMLLGLVYRPGPRKNMVFALYGTSAMIGFFVGILVAGLVAQYLRWGFYFWIGAVMACVTLVTSICAIPDDRQQRPKSEINMDLWGALTIASGLILVVFSVTEATHASKGWRTPYIATLFCVGWLALFLAIFLEGWVAQEPLLPSSVFKVPAMKPLMFAISLFGGTLGIYLLYGISYYQNIMHASPLQVVAWFAPFVIASLLLNVAAGLILHLVPGRALLITSAIGALGSHLLLALVPSDGTYWAWILPAMILGTLGIEWSYTVVSVFVTTVLPSAQQGLAGGLVNSVLQLGIAVFLGFSDTIQSHNEGADLRGRYKDTFWFGTGIAALALILIAIWGGAPRARSDLTAQERVELEEELGQR